MGRGRSPRGGGDDDDGESSANHAADDPSPSIAVHPERDVPSPRVAHPETPLAASVRGDGADGDATAWGFESSVSRGDDGGGFGIRRRAVGGGGGGGGASRRCLMCAWMLRDGGAGRRVAFLASLVGMTIANVVVVMSLTSAAAAAAAPETLDAIERSRRYSSPSRTPREWAPCVVGGDGAFPHYARAAAVAFLGAAHWSYALDVSRGSGRRRGDRGRG